MYLLCIRQTTMAEAQSIALIKSGFVYVHRQQYAATSKWRKRWLVLCNIAVQYYETKNDELDVDDGDRAGVSLPATSLSPAEGKSALQSARGIIPLIGLHVEQSKRTDRMILKSEHCGEIAIECGDAPSCLAWIEALRKAIEEVRGLGWSYDVAASDLCAAHGAHCIWLGRCGSCGASFEATAVN